MRRSEARLQRLLDRNLAGIYRITWDGTILECNEAFARMLGPFAPSDLRGRRIQPFYRDVGDRSRVLEELTRAATFTAREICMQRDDGTIVWVLSTAMSVSLENGAREIEGTVVDITAGKQANDALRESEARFRSVVLAAGTPIICTDLEPRITEFNPAAERVFGITRQAALGQLYMSLFPSAVRAKVQADLRRVAGGDVIAGFENVVEHPDGGITVVLWNIQPLVDAERRPRGVVAIGQDITARQRAEESLMRQARYLRALTATDRAILALQKPEAIAQAVLLHIGALLPCRGAAVVTFDIDAGVARLLASVGDPGAPHPESRLLHRDDFIGEPRTVPAVDGRSRMLLLPLVVHGAPIGLLQVHQGDYGTKVTSSEIELAGQVADRLAVALHNWGLYEKVADARRRLEAVSTRLVDVQEAERRRLARELHDEIGQSLTVLKMQLELSAERADPACLARASSVVHQLINQVRDLSLELRPAILDDFGLLPALLWHVERFAELTGVRVKFEHDGIDRRLAHNLETAGYRVIQEALTNVARHARITTVRVGIRATATQMLIEIEDAGAGFDVLSLPRTPSTGLSGMRERATLLGGTLNVTSTPGAGTLIRASIPLHTGGDDAAQRGGGA